MWSSSNSVGEPPVEAGHDGVLLDVDVAGVVAVAVGVVLGELAAVVGPAVAPVALHPPAADAAVHPPGEHVVAAGFVGVRVVGALADGRTCAWAASNSSRLTSGSWVGSVDVIHWSVVVPAHLGDVPEGDVVDVDEHLVLALLVPHLVAGVARVGEDGPHGGLGPLALPGGTVPVAAGIVRRRRRDAVAVEARGDQVEALARGVLGEDALHDRRGDRVGREPAEPLADGGLGRVGVRAGVDELVAVGRAAAEEPALDRGLGRHRACGRGS